MYVPCPYIRCPSSAQNNDTTPHTGLNRDCGYRGNFTRLADCMIYLKTMYGMIPVTREWCADNFIPPEMIEFE